MSSELKDRLDISSHYLVKPCGCKMKYCYIKVSIQLSVLFLKFIVESPDVLPTLKPIPYFKYYAGNTFVDNLSRFDNKEKL